MTTLKRRQALQLLGLAGASYAASSMGPSPMRIFSRARAAASTVPRRVVFFYTEQGSLKRYNMDGTLEPLWTPTAAGMPHGKDITKPWSTTEYTFGSHHVPLNDWKKKLLLLHGMDMASWYKDESPRVDDHVRGATHALVAAPRQGPALAGGISIDQYIATNINSAGALTAFPSLELAASASQENRSANVSYAGPGQPLPEQGIVAGVYDRLFPNGPQDEGQAAEQMKLVKQQQSVLDFAQGGFTSTSKQLTALDKKRLDAHGAAIRDLESRLALRSGVTCVEPERADILAGTSSAMWGADPSVAVAAYAANADAQMRLIQVALACDLTRVVTLHLSEVNGAAFGYKSINGTTDFHDLVHKTSGPKGPTVTLAGHAEANATVQRYHAYNSAMFAKLLGMLDSIPEADGTTLLDNTAVVWVGQIAGGDHSVDHIPYIIGGGLGGAVSPGRFVVLPRTADKAKWPMYSRGLAHQDLFVSLAQAMGVETDTFGDPTTCGGPLPSGVLT